MRISETGAWEQIPGLALKIVLPAPASIRVLYAMSIMPDHDVGASGTAAEMCHPFCVGLGLILYLFLAMFDLVIR